MDGLREDTAGPTGAPRDLNVPAGTPGQAGNRSRGRAPSTTDGDALVAEAAAAFEAVEEAASVAVARIKEFERATEESMDRLATHRSAALEREVSGYIDELADLRNQLSRALHESMVESAATFEQRVASYSNSLVRDHATQLERVAEAQAERLRQAGLEVTEQIAGFRRDAAAEIDRGTVEASARLEQITRRGARMRRLNLVALGVVAVVAIVALVLATSTV